MDNLLIQPRSAGTVVPKGNGCINDDADRNQCPRLDILQVDQDIPGNKQDDHIDRCPKVSLQFAGIFYCLHNILPYLYQPPMA